MDNHLDIGIGVYDCLGTHPQQWSRSERGVIMNGNKCLEGALSANSVVQLTDCDKSRLPFQHWIVTIVQDGWVQLRVGKLCISGASTPLKLKPCAVDRCDQLWRLMESHNEFQRVLSLSFSLFILSHSFSRSLARSLLCLFVFNRSPYVMEKVFFFLSAFLNMPLHTLLCM